MRVRCYDVDEDGGERLRTECELDECYPDDPETLARASNELERAGRYWDGGGAAPVVLLMRVRP